MIDLYDLRVEQAIEEKWAYSTFLEMLLTDALEKREHKQLTLRLAKSHLNVSKSLETFDFAREDLIAPTRLIRELGTCAFIEKKQNVFFFGKSGLGKSHLAQGIGHQACRRGYDVLFQCAKGLLDWIYAGIGDGTRKKRLSQAIKTSLLILDDFGLQELTEEQQKDLYQIIAERYEKKPLILTTNRSISEWPSIFSHPLLGSAAVDRLVHKGIEVILEGPSHRFNEYKKMRETLNN
jgi:DNA replication protein DnaC